MKPYWQNKETNINYRIVYQDKEDIFLKSVGSHDMQGTMQDHREFPIDSRDNLVFTLGETEFDSQFSIKKSQLLKDYFEIQEYNKSDYMGSLKIQNIETSQYRF